LWDDAPETEDTLLKAHANGIRLLDLTNALAPIDVVDVQEIKEAPEVPAVKTDREEALEKVLNGIKEKQIAEEYRPEAFTEEELRMQPISALRRQAKLLGIEIEKTTTKEQLIGILLNGLDDIGLVEPAIIEETSATSVVIHRADGSSVTYMFASDKIEHVENLLSAIQLLAM
jgi:hypothetical protein